MTGFEREKKCDKTSTCKRRCNCRNEVYHRQIAPGMYQQMTVQVCEECPTVKYVREGDFVTVDTENGMQDGQVQSKCIIFLPVIYLLWLACCNFFREQQG